jgi:ATP-dependent DNA helicase RecQ
MQLADPQFDVFMKALLRTYEGVFIDYVRIRERDIARQLEISPDEVKAYLLRLDRRDIIDYIAAQSGERITFLQVRPPAGDIYVNMRVLKANKKRARKRWQAMKSYIYAERCRTHVLLAYFGEAMDKPCGSCDICLGSQRKTFQDTERKKNIEAALAKTLSNEKSLSIRRWTYRYPVVFQKRLLNLLSELESEGKIRLNSKLEIEASNEK